MKHSFDTQVSLVQVETVSTRDASITSLIPLEVVAVNQDGTFLVRSASGTLATGTARRHPEDRQDSEIGRNLSIGRAFATLGHRCIKRGNGLVKHADDVKIAKATQKARRPKGQHVRVARSSKILTVHAPSDAS